MSALDLVRDLTHRVRESGDVAATPEAGAADLQEAFFDLDGLEGALEFVGADEPARPLFEADRKGKLDRVILAAARYRAALK